MADPEPSLIFKEFACCIATPCAAQATLALATEHAINPATVVAITVTFPPGGDAPLLVTRPETGVDGRFSLEYVVARALTQRCFSVGAFDEKLVPADVQMLGAEVTRLHDENAPRMSNDPETRFSVVEIRLADGTSLIRRENAVNVVADPSVKFLDATGDATALLDAIRTMTTSDQLRQMLNLLTGTTNA